MIQKDQECDKKTRMIMELDLITKNVMGAPPRGSHKNVDVVGIVVNDPQ